MSHGGFGGSRKRDGVEGGVWDFFEQVIMYKLYDALERFAVLC